MHPEWGQCGPLLAPEAYLDCYNAQSEWIPQWADRVQRANVMLDGCSFMGVPMTLYTRRDDIMLWWAQRLQGSSKPYTRHTATIAANQKPCEP